MTDAAPRTGSIVGIALRAVPGAPMQTPEKAAITVPDGLEGDGPGGTGARGEADRAVTVLFEDDWQTVCDVTGGKTPWTIRRANLLIGGMTNPRADGGRLEIGEVVLQVTGEARPCVRINQRFPGLLMVLGTRWRGGLTCRVVAGGPVAVGDAAVYRP